MKTALKVASWATLIFTLMIAIYASAGTGFQDTLVGCVMFAINPVMALLFIREIEKNK